MSKQEVANTDAFAGTIILFGPIVVGFMYFGAGKDIPDVKITVVDSRTQREIEDDIVQIIF